MGRQSIHRRAEVGKEEPEGQVGTEGKSLECQGKVSQ